MPVEGRMEGWRIDANRACLLLERFPMKPVFSKQPLKTAPLLSRGFGGMRDVPAKRHEGLDEVGPLGIHRGGRLHGAQRPRERNLLLLVDGALYVPSLYGGRRAHHHGALNRAFQFPHIARPGMREKFLHGLIGKPARPLAIGALKTLQEPLGQ